ncbi:MAG: hypothetical protein AAB875_03065, partial [Patescibacteria group bacterium]
QKTARMFTPESSKFKISETLQKKLGDEEENQEKGEEKKLPKMAKVSMAPVYQKDSFFTAFQETVDTIKSTLGKKTSVFASVDRNYKEHPLSNKHAERVIDNDPRHIDGMVPHIVREYRQEEGKQFVVTYKRDPKEASETQLQRLVQAWDRLLNEALIPFLNEHPELYEKFTPFIEEFDAI